MVKSSLVLWTDCLNMSTFFSMCWVKCTPDMQVRVSSTQLDCLRAISSLPVSWANEGPCSYNTQKRLLSSTETTLFFPFFQLHTVQVFGFFGHKEYVRHWVYLHVQLVQSNKLSAIHTRVCGSQTQPGTTVVRAGVEQP